MILCNIIQKFFFRFLTEIKVQFCNFSVVSNTLISQSFSGLIVGQFAWQSKMLMKPGKIRSLIIANFLVITTIIVYVGLLRQGYNPLWSVPLAEKYCTIPNGVKIETQPFFTIVRFAGAALGMGKSD